MDAINLWVRILILTDEGSKIILHDSQDQNPVPPDRRFTITHGNFANAASIERSKRLGVLWDCQIAWHYLDGPALKEAFGPERMK